MPGIEERLVALERRCRRATQANVALVVLVAEPDGTGGTLPRLRMGLRREGEPFLQMHDATGRPQFTAPPTERPSPKTP